MTQKRLTRVAVPSATVTQMVLHASGAPEAKPALVDACEGTALTYAELISTTAAASAGLVRRGVRTGDVAAVHASSVREYVLALHTLVAAGAAAVPLPADAPVEELADRLTDCDARLLMTAPSLADDALAATERSRVRQVFAFGQVPGTTPYAELLSDGPRPEPAIDPPRDLALIFCETAPLGQPPTTTALTHAQWVAELRDLLGVAVDCGVVFVPPPRRPDRAYAVTIDLALVLGATLLTVDDPGCQGP
ncbi:MAG: AMP-binding protein [Streptosporangiales bacterium]|nr:AMP-binding protein [Streptosporangiales bacterium]